MPAAGWVDLEAAWAETVRSFRDLGSAERVRVRLRPAATGPFLRMAAEHLAGPVTERAATLVFPSLGAATTFLAGYVAEVEVLGPTELPSGWPLSAISCFAPIEPVHPLQAVHPPVHQPRSARQVSRAGNDGAGAAANGLSAGVQQQLARAPRARRR